jgi:hypothetical protein
MRCSVALLVLFAVPRLGLANPTVTDSKQRPSTMLWEKVTVHVGTKVSKVDATYRFRLGHDEHPPVPRDHVTVWLPVLMPDGDEKSYEKQFGSPVVRLAGKKFPVEAWHDISRDDRPVYDFRPPRSFRDMEIASYYCDIPLRSLKPEFELEISYDQPHAAGDIVGYVPFRPPGNHGTSRIVFQAETGFLVRKPSWLAPFTKARQSLEFVPKPNCLIQVQSISLGKH